jgi:hypothetical protein
MEARVQSIEELGSRRDRILESPEIDLEALAILVDDYEAANMTSAAADLAGGWTITVKKISLPTIPIETACLVDTTKYENRLFSRQPKML